MNLLLLFSALFSALTGVASSDRARPTAAAVSVSVAETVCEAVEEEAGSVRPSAAIPELIEVAGHGVLPIVAPFTGEPIYASRRRE